MEGKDSVNRLNAFRMYQKTYKNYITVTYRSLRKQEYIRVILKDNRTFYWQRKYVSLYADALRSGKLKNIEIFDNTFKFTYNNKDVCLDLGMHSNICDVFFTDEYAFLNPTEKTVIDIGANIGDSTIYFVIKGAKKVIGLEPYPYTYTIASNNIKINKLEDRAEVINAGYGSDGYITVDPSKISTTGDELKECKNGGKTIELLSLKSLVERYYINEGILKMDCEGCEYHMLDEDNATLSRFKQILIEYHYGYKNLKERLENAGFTVKYTTPSNIYHKETTNPNMVVGYIYAEKF